MRPTPTSVTLGGFLLFLIVVGPTRAEEPMFQGRPAVEVILERIDGDGWKVNSPTNRTLILEQMGPEVAVPALASILGLSDWRESPAYAKAWNSLPDIFRKAVPPPVTYSRTDRALFFLREFGPWASNAIPALVREFKRGDEDRKLNVAMTLSGMAPASAAAVDVLTKDLAGAGPDLQTGILRVLQKLGPLAGASVPRIQDQIQGGTEAIKAEAVDALWAVARDTNAVLEALRPLIAGAEPEAANTMGGTLYWMGPAARPLVADVLGAIPKWPPAERNEIFMVLGRMAGANSEVMELLRSTIAPDSTEPREAIRAAVVSLGDIGPAAAPAVPAMIELWKRQPELSFDPKQDRQEAPVRSMVSAIVQTLGKIGPASQTALPMLEQVWRPGGEPPKAGGKGLAINAAVAIWGIDLGKTHSAAELIHDWREWVGPQYERMVTMRSGMRMQLESLWEHQPDVLELLKHGDPNYLRRLTELREDALSHW